LSDLYLDLMERCLLGLIYKDPPLDPWHGIIRDAEGRVVKLGEGIGALTIDAGTFDAQTRHNGADWPATAHTMIGAKRLRNWRDVIESTIELGIPGDFVEAGVWRGGACILAAAILKSRCIQDRVVWACDSFEGLPPPDSRFPSDAKDWHHKIGPLAVSLEQVQENFRTYDLLSPEVKFLKGWFKDTLQNAPIERIAVLRVDGDMYESTLDVLNALYSKVSSGGVVIIDDYNSVRGCQTATNDFRERLGITDPIIRIDPYGVYWEKTT